MLLKNRNIISKIRRSKVTDYAALKGRRSEIQDYFAFMGKARLKQSPPLQKLARKLKFPLSE